MSYKINVRTDIIDPHTYLELELNYKQLIETIDKCGGYALFQQIYKWYGSKSKGFREIKKLEELLLVGSEQLNNNKYIYLKSTALKYLKYREHEEEVKEPKINRLLNKPGFRPLMGSVYSLEYLIENKEHINSVNSLETFDLVVVKALEAFNSNRFQYLHLGKLSDNNDKSKLNEKFVDQIKTKLKILNDRNAIYLKSYEPSSDFKNSTLNFVWFDYDQSTEGNMVLKVFRLISRLLNNMGTTGKGNLLNACNFSLEIVTLSEERQKVLEVITKRALESIEKKNNFYLTNSFNKTKENHVISNVKDINYKVLADVEGYLRVTTKGDSELSFVNEKVIDRLDELKEHLKGGK